LVLITHKLLQNNGAEEMKQDTEVMQTIGDIQEQENSVITIVLTADNHLGYAASSQHPRKREQRKQQLRHAFQQAVDFAIDQGVDLFVQAGDLFDSINPDEQDRSFVAECLAQLRQSGIRTFAVSGIQDAPVETHFSIDTGKTDFASSVPAPQLSYARLGALHYFAPSTSMSKPQNSEHAPGIQPLEPVVFDIRGTTVGICGLGVLAGQEGDPLENLRVQSDIERAAISLLVLHAPIEGFAMGTSLLGIHAQVSQARIANQSAFRYILAGYHHAYRHLSIGLCDLIVAGATQHIDFSDPDDDPGFVFLGLTADGVRWCKHITVEALQLHRLVVQASDLWPASPPSPLSIFDGEGEGGEATTSILERLHPFCADETMVQLRLEGELTRSQYHQLDLNRVRLYGEEHCFDLEIDDSAFSFLSEQEFISSADGQASTRRKDERLSPREELIALADEWIAAAPDEQEQKALQATKEELLAALRYM
jgi:DNA repair exonuclease SbcCD nuclease subunit